MDYGSEEVPVVKNGLKPFAQLLGNGFSGQLWFFSLTSMASQVHSVQFMEFAEMENHDDFYTVEEAYIHTQDQRGVLVMYDVALQDLKKTEKQLLLVASQYIEAGKGKAFM